MTHTVSMADLRDGDVVALYGAYLTVTNHRPAPHQDNPDRLVYIAQGDMSDPGTGERYTGATLPGLFRGLTSWRISSGEIIRDWCDVSEGERATATAVWGLQGNALATYPLIRREAS